MIDSLDLRVILAVFLGLVRVRNVLKYPLRLPQDYKPQPQQHMSSQEL